MLHFITEWICQLSSIGSQDSLLVKSTGLVIERLWVWIPAGLAGEVSSLELTVCSFLFCVHSTPRVTTAPHKRPQSFCQKCRWQVTPEDAYTLKPILSSQLAEPLWTDFGIKSAITWGQANVHFKKKKKKHRRGNEWSNILPKSSQVMKKLPPLQA